MVKSSLILLTVWTFLQGFFSQFQQVLPKNIDLLDEIILLVLTFYWIGRIILGNAKFKRTPFDFVLILFLVYVLISSLLNSFSPFISLLAIRDTFQYLLLFYILVQLDIIEKDLILLFKIAFISALLQFVVIIIQLSSYYLQTGSLFLEDLADGTFGLQGSHKLGYFMGMMIITSFVLYLSRREFKFLLFTLIFCITLVITSSRGAYFLTGGTLLFLFSGHFFKSVLNFVRVIYKGHLFKSRRNIVPALLILIFLGVTIFFFNQISTGTFAMINPETLISQQLGLTPGTGRRIGLTYFSYNLLRNSEYPLIGISPGNLSKTSLYFPQSEIAEEIESLSRDTEYTLVLNQLSTTLLEYGFIGCPFIILIFVGIYNINRRIYRKKRNPLLNNWSFIFKGVFLIYFLGVLAEKVFEIQELSFYFWFLFSAIYLIDKNNGKDQST